MKIKFSRIYSLHLSSEQEYFSIIQKFIDSNTDIISAHETKPYVCITDKEGRELVICYIESEGRHIKDRGVGLYDTEYTDLKESQAEILWKKFELESRFLVFAGANKFEWDIEDIGGY